MTSSAETTEYCPFPENDALYVQYHDQEWGIPATSDQAFFEKLCLEGFQSGLSWKTILHKRDALRRLFDDFNAKLICHYTNERIEQICCDVRGIRNRRKIQSVLNNASCFNAMQNRGESLSALFWSYEPSPHSRPTRVSRQWLAANPVSPESTNLAAALKKLGWSFVGPTNVYATMQALGIVNDHVVGCPRRIVINQIRNNIARPNL